MFWRRHPHADDREDAQLRIALGRDGCPVCEFAAGSDERWLDAFLYESYRVPEVLEDVRRGPGFCGDHGRSLLARGLYSSTIATVHGILVRHVRARLSEATRARGVGQRARWETSCRACTYRREAEARTTFFLALIVKKDALASYARPGAVCIPHLPLLAARLPDAQLGTLIDTHRDLVAEARTRLGAVAQGPCPREEIEGWIRRVLGNRPRFPSTVVAPSDSTPEMDPVRRLRARLADPEACAVCATIDESRRRWLAWLDENAARGETIDDVLPLCRRHVWEAIDRGGSTLRATASLRAVHNAHSHLRMAHKALVHPGDGNDSPADRPLAKARALIGTRLQRLAAPGQARALLTYPPNCPVCRLVAHTRDRTIALLGALIEEQAGRAAFEAGYGLCVRHAVHALGFLDSAAARRAVASVTRARLAVLGWELDEQLHKVGWSARPEERGTERGAWRRAVLRFSGTLCADGS